MNSKQNFFIIFILLFNILTIVEASLKKAKVKQSSIIKKQKPLTAPVVTVPAVDDQNAVLTDQQNEIAVSVEELQKELDEVKTEQQNEKVVITESAQKGLDKFVDEILAKYNMQNTFVNRLKVTAILKLAVFTVVFGTITITAAIIDKFKSKIKNMAEKRVKKEIMTFNNENDRAKNEENTKDIAQSEASKLFDNLDELIKQTQQYNFSQSNNLSQHNTTKNDFIKAITDKYKEFTRGKYDSFFKKSCNEFLKLNYYDALVNNDFYFTDIAEEYSDKNISLRYDTFKNRMQNYVDFYNKLNGAINNRIKLDSNYFDYATKIVKMNNDELKILNKKLYENYQLVNKKLYTEKNKPEEEVINLLDVMNSIEKENPHLMQDIFAEVDKERKEKEEKKLEAVSKIHDMEQLINVAEETYQKAKKAYDEEEKNKKMKKTGLAELKRTKDDSFNLLKGYLGIFQETLNESKNLLDPKFFETYSQFLAKKKQDNLSAGVDAEITDVHKNLVDKRIDKKNIANNNQKIRDGLKKEII